MIRQTGRYYVRVTHGFDKWYKAVLSVGFGRLRLSKARFARARDAEAYREAVLARLARLRDVRRRSECGSRS